MLISTDLIYKMEITYYNIIWYESLFFFIVQWYPTTIVVVRFCFKFKHFKNNIEKFTNVTLNFATTVGEWKLQLYFL